MTNYGKSKNFYKGGSVLTGFGAKQKFHSPQKKF